MGALRNNPSTGRPYLDVTQSGGEHFSSRRSRADDVKRREAVYREGFVDGLAHALNVLTAPSIEAARKIEEAMNA